MTKPTINDLISPEYREMNNVIYSRAGQSTQGAKWAKRLHARIIQDYAPKSILDYGCGQGQFKEAFDALGLGHEVYEFDPCIDGKDALPEPVDFVLCADVLEHVEEDKIDNVLKHIFSLAKKGGFFLICQCDTKIVLPDGRNAHILKKNINWWCEKIMPYCTVTECKVRMKKKEIKDFTIWFKSDEKE